MIWNSKKTLLEQRLSTALYAIDLKKQFVHVWRKPDAKENYPTTRKNYLVYFHMWFVFVFLQSSILVLGRSEILKKFKKDFYSYLRSFCVFFFLYTTTSIIYFYSSASFAHCVRGFVESLWSLMLILQDSVSNMFGSSHTYPFSNDRIV